MAKTAPNSPTKRGGGTGKGRMKGSLNRTTLALKEAILSTFDSLGGPQFLESLAEERPELFISLLGKLIPSEIKAQVSESSSLEIIVMQNATPWPQERLEQFSRAHDEKIILGPDGKALGVLIPFTGNATFLLEGGQ